MDPKKEELKTELEERKAHALSLHLYSILSRVLDSSDAVRKAEDDLKSFLKSQSLEDHISVLMKEGISGVGLEARTGFGDSVLLELYARCDFFPCPEGECQYATNSFCKWCCKLKR